MKLNNTPRGVRNHNPLNIVIGNDWQGESKYQTDPQFEVFIADEFGFRAAFIILRRYINKYHRHTITAIVHSWCPDSTADVYVSIVSQRTGIHAAAPIRFEDKKTMVAIAQAMAYVETGQYYSEQLISRSYDMV